MRTGIPTGNWPEVGGPEAEGAVMLGKTNRRSGRDRGATETRTILARGARRSLVTISCRMT